MAEGGNVVKSVEILNKESKNGNPYKQIAITFVNGYVYTNFLTDEQYFILKSVVSEN